MENKQILDISPTQFIYLIEVSESYIVYYPEDNYRHSFKDKSKALMHAKKISISKRIPIYINTSSSKGIMSFDTSVLNVIDKTKKNISEQPAKTRRLSVNG